jgi:hypothetical protein
MVLTGRRLSAQEYAAVRDDPELVDDLLGGEPDDGETGAGCDLDLDKAWHGLHFLLAGRAWEVGPGAGQAILGGEPIGDDRGYGPACLYAPDLVREVAAGLAGVDEQELRRRFDPQALSAADIYPGIWDEGEEAFEYLAAHYSDLCDFYDVAAARGSAVLIAVT